MPFWMLRGPKGNWRKQNYCLNCRARSGIMPHKGNAMATVTQENTLVLTAELVRQLRIASKKRRNAGLVDHRLHRDGSRRKGGGGPRPSRAHRTVGSRV